MIIIPSNEGSAEIPKDIKLSNIKLDSKGISELNQLIAYGHGHTQDQVVFSKLSWTEKYILGDIIEELHKEIEELKNTIKKDNIK